MFNEEDIYGRPDEHRTSQVEVGTVGWDDSEDYFEHGKDHDDGYTLVYVTLYRGRQPNPYEKPKTGVAGGHRLKCHISDGVLRMPKKGARVYVILPGGAEYTQGAGVIVASVSPSKRTEQFEKDRVVMDFGDDVHVVIRGKSVSISDHENRFIGVGTPRAGGDAGLLFQAKDGSGGFIKEGVVSWFVASGGDAKTIIQMTPASLEAMQKDGGGTLLKMGSGTFHSFAATNKMQGAGCYIGALPLAANTAHYGTAGPGTPSTSVFLSP